MGKNRFLDIVLALRPSEHMVAFEFCHTQKKDRNYRQNLNHEQRLRFKRENELCISFSLLQPVLPTERQGKQGWQELEATAAGPKEEGEWEMDGELGLWERGQPVGSWSEEGERTGGGAFPDSICAKWHQVNR